MSKKTGKTNGQRMRKSTLIEKIMEFLQKESKRSFNYKQIAHAIGAESPANRNDIINILDDLAIADEIDEVSLGKYKAKGYRTFRQFHARK